MKRIGYRNVIFSTILPFAVFLFYALQKDSEHAINSFLVFLIISIGVGLYTFIIIDFGEKEITISYLINPFKKKITLSYNIIDKAWIRQGNLTSINFFYKNEELEVSTFLSRKELRAFAKVMEENNVFVDSNINI